MQSLEHQLHIFVVFERAGVVAEQILGFQFAKRTPAATALPGQQQAQAAQTRRRIGIPIRAGLPDHVAASHQTAVTDHETVRLGGGGAVRHRAGRDRAQARHTEREAQRNRAQWRMMHADGLPAARHNE